MIPKSYSRPLNLRMDGLTSTNPSMGRFLSIRTPLQPASLIWYAVQQRILKCALISLARSACMFPAPSVNGMPAQCESISLIWKTVFCFCSYSSTLTIFYSGSSIQGSTFTRFVLEKFQPILAPFFRGLSSKLNSPRSSMMIFLVMTPGSSYNIQKEWFLI